MLSISVVAQPQAKEEAKEEEGFKFETIKELPVTSVKDQNQAGTCWCYSSLAFFEAELLRMGKPEYDFSEMYIVYKTYLDRAEAAVRTHGDVSFSQGGSFGDVLYAIKHYGLVPDELMPAGAMHGDSLDRKGNRIGRGRGYYDRFLCQHLDVKRIGICFDFQLVEEVPTEPLDIRMDEVISL